MPKKEAWLAAREHHRYFGCWCRHTKADYRDVIRAVERLKTSCCHYLESVLPRKKPSCAPQAAPQKTIAVPIEQRTVAYQQVITGESPELPGR